jgi:hypothetical protein
MLFPYGVQKENLNTYQRWNQESTLSAADIYAAIGSPPLFRLRYLFSMLPSWFRSLLYPK